MEYKLEDKEEREKKNGHLKGGVLDEEGVVSQDKESLIVQGFPLVSPLD